MQRLLRRLGELGGSTCALRLLGAPLPLLLFRRQNVRRALIAREQVRAVFGFQERVERFDARDDADEIVVAECEHGVDQIVALALLAELDFEAIGEEGEESCSATS